MKGKIDLTKMNVVLFLAGICCFLWGSATPAIKIGYKLFQIDSADTASILLFAGTRFLMAGILVIAFHSAADGHWIMPPKGSGAAIASIGLSQTVFQYIFYYVGLSHATGVHSAVITGTNVFFSMLCASLVFRYEKLNMQKIAGCALGFLGIVVVNLSGAGAEGLFDVSFLGEGFVLLAQIFYALSGSLVKKHSQKFDVVTLSGFLSAIAYTLWGVLLKYNPVSRVTVFGFMNPMFGVVLSAIFLGESGQALTWNTFVALILVCLGIYVVNRKGDVKTAG